MFHLREMYIWAKLSQFAQPDDFTAVSDYHYYVSCATTPHRGFAFMYTHPAHRRVCEHLSPWHRSRVRASWFMVRRIRYTHIYYYMHQYGKSISRVFFSILIIILSEKFIFEQKSHDAEYIDFKRDDERNIHQRVETRLILRIVGACVGNSALLGYIARRGPFWCM